MLRGCGASSVVSRFIAINALLVVLASACARAAAELFPI
jgi:hypothetical protein